jgi:hypothetical protein
MLENNKIRNKTETTGFLDIIMNIPENIDMTAIISVMGREYPLYKSGMTYILNINFFLLVLSINNIISMFIDKNPNIFTPFLDSNQSKNIFTLPLRRRCFLRCI